ncbi:unnamed protein product [Chilo suppressalis]|uniref:Uncharacterized protein n=1 Tax=Chilo suppressalis TaxID=168631 RepID=A0ABN8B2H8_CHISP|nr:unnamed protein product [Chilo suppressalis]
MLQMVHTVTAHLPMSSERKQNFINETKNNLILSQLYLYYLKGWPTEHKVLNNCKQFFKLKDNIYF